ncbi:MAG: ABC transporter C-terminal domain-containing protein [Acidobacteriota bacterium]
MSWTPLKGHLSGVHPAAAWGILLAAAFWGTVPAPAAGAEPPAPAAISPRNEGASPDGNTRLEEMEEKIHQLEEDLAALRRRETAPAGDVVLELQRRMEILSREIEKLTIGEAADEAAGSVHGFGPAASKVYHKKQGVSIGGYGEMLFENPDARRDDGSPSGAVNAADLKRAVFYIGYRFSDHLLFNSELEFERGTTGKGGEASVEFAYLDFLFNEKINARAGLLLMPMGFLNELHEPPVFLGAKRPELERRLIPTTWRENGAGVFGRLGQVSYRAYLVTGFDGAGLKGENDGFGAGGLRGGRQKGADALAEDLALVVRADWQLAPGLTLGGAFYTGDSGQGAVAPSTQETIQARTDILDLHAEWRWRGLEARGLYVHVDLDDADLINDFQGLSGSDSVGAEMNGHYLQVGYDVLSRLKTQQALTPFVRHEEFDTQAEVPSGFLRDPARDVELWTFGMSYKPIENVVLKLDFQNQDNRAGTGTDQWSLAIGWLF